MKKPSFGISIAVTIRSLDPTLGLRCTGFWCFYTPSWISIAVAIRSLDPTLGLLEAGRISIALIIHSLDRRGSLSQSLFIPLIAPYKLYFSNRL